MKTPRLRLLALGLLLSLAVPLRAEGLSPIRLAPEEIRLVADASRPGGMAVAVLSGDLGKPGLYAARILMPAGLKVLPHVHPEDRLVVVLSGTLSFGFGERYDPALMKPLPAGSFFVEPAGRPHFAWTGDADVVVQVSGIGPSGTVYLQAGRE